MSFSSNLNRCKVYDDRNYRELLNGVKIAGAEMGTGYVERDWKESPFGSSAFAAPYEGPILDRSEWTNRIEELERTRSLISQLQDEKNLPCLNQKNVPYCWCFGVVGAVHALRARMGLPFISLSPASAAAKVKKYRKVGGWGIQAIEGINKYGICTTDLWPAIAVDRKYDTEESRKNAALHSIPEFWELPPKNFDAVMSCLLQGYPVPAGLLWWGHLVYFCDPVVLGRNEFGVKFRNSWSERWGDNGYGILAESKATPDEATAPRTVTVTLE